MNKEIIIMIGNIGSGKSTIARKYATEGYRVISRDALRYMVGGGKYTFDLNLEASIKKSAVKILETFMKNRISIVYDETNVSKNLRVDTIQLAKKYNYKIIAYVLPCLSKEQSVDRRMKDPHGQNSREIWNSVWERFNSMYEEPSKDEGFDEIILMKE
jgi:predicted kinase